MSVERGVIHYRDRARQILSFEKLERHRKITPSDIDGILDYGGNAFVILEAKFFGAPYLYGQRRLHQNMVMGWHAANIPAMIVLFEHRVPPEKDVIVWQCPVKEVFFNKQGHWSIPVESRNVLETVERFEEWCTKKGVKI